MDPLSVIINSVGVLISVFAIAVAYRIHMDYKLHQTSYFLVSAIFFMVWNSIHLIFAILPADTNLETVKTMWIVVVHSGLIFLFGIVIGYHRLNNQELKPRMLLYLFFGGFCSAIFLFKPEWVAVEYHLSDGFTTSISNTTFWTLFAIISGLIAFREIMIPFARSFLREDLHRSTLIFLTVAIIMAIFSNLTLPFLRAMELPQSLRFLMADIGLLIFFTVLLKSPFLGMYDPAKLHQLILANTDGETLLVLSENEREDLKPLLASSAFISINSILEEVVDIEDKNGPQVMTREIQLSHSHFTIVIRNRHVLIAWYSNPTGVMYSKVQALARLTDLDADSLSIKFLEEFKDRVQTFCPQFPNHAQHYTILDDPGVKY